MHSSPQPTPSAASRTVAITGGAGGIGNAIAAAFLEAGDRVILIDRDAAGLAGSGELLTPTEHVTTLPLDITDEEAVAHALADLKPLGGVDILVNNAGILSVHGSLTEISAAAFRSIVDVNIVGTFIVSQAFARHRSELAGGGTIVNISSIGGQQPTPGMGAYEASKAAVDSLTRWSAIELAHLGIRVNAVAPGPVLTPMLAREMPEGSAARTAWASRIPLGDLAQVEDVAAAVRFLASAEASHITGTVLPVDGGQLLT